MQFRHGNANHIPPFPDAVFDAVICVDSIVHFVDCAHVLQEWYWLLRPAGRLLFTDPAVVTGLIAGEEAARSAMGFLVFAPPGANERLIATAGFTLLRREDLTAGLATIARRRRTVRTQRQSTLIQIEGEAAFQSYQHLVATTYTLASEQRIARWDFSRASPLMTMGVRSVGGGVKRLPSVFGNPIYCRAAGFLLCCTKARSSAAEHVRLDRA